MRCPTLADLPPPPPGKTGWPWTEECDQLPELRPDRTPWPRISIVTPSYNQGHFIEETIRSILLQGYPDLEYFIMDGGSTDESVDVILRYAKWLTYWESEKDRGQAHAINKGLDRATGSIFQWINSDDLLAFQATKIVASCFDGEGAVVGFVQHFGGDRTFVSANVNLNAVTLLHHPVPYNVKRLHAQVNYDQPGVWLRADVLKDIGGLDESKHYIFDLAMTVSYLERENKLSYVSEIIVHFRHHVSSKTESLAEQFFQEHFNFLQQLAEQDLPEVSEQAGVILHSLELEGSVTEIFDRSLSRADRLRRLVRIVKELPGLRSLRFYSSALMRVLLERRREPSRDIMH